MPWTPSRHRVRFVQTSASVDNSGANLWVIIRREEPAPAGVRTPQDRYVTRGADRFSGCCMIELRINGQLRSVDVPANVPLLWVLRDVLGLTGTKFGCGIAQCGACTVHLNGNAVRSCVLPIGSIGNRAITTIEGVGATPAGASVQKAWLDAEVVQCGYCQSGQIMSASALLATTPHPTDGDIDAAMAGNICRCGTYVRIRAAIKNAAQIRAARAKDAGGATDA